MTAGTRTGEVLGRLSLAEKAALCLGSDFWHTAPVGRAGVPAIMLADGPHGLRRQPDEGDHVGIGGSLPATCFPTASALGSSWDPELVERVGAAIGAEARAQGVSVVLGPGINIKRSPLCGRNFEYLSEDPLVSGVLGAALVEGLQSQGVGASVKHFAANNQETDRLRVSADVDERALREIYLAGFERVVTSARPWTVMCSYNKLNGVYASQNRWLLTDVLRDEWGFDGLVMSDWGAVHDRVAALAAGLDLEMPPKLGISDAQIVAAVENGSLDEAVLDEAVLRVLRLVERASPAALAGAGTALGSFDVESHHALARAAAADSLVLLRNDDAILPLHPADGGVVAVIGEFARTARYQGAGSSQVNPTRVETALDELRAALPSGVEVAFAPGFTIAGQQGNEGAADAGREDLLAAEAVELAVRAGTVVAFLGLPAVDESEGFDRTHIDLPANQLALLPRLAAANPHLVVVLSNGSAVRVSTWEEHAPAIVECWLAGQAAGGAVADVLLGKVNPSGRLAETIPHRLEDTPSYLNFPGEDGHVRYGEGVFVGYRGHDAIGQDVSYPFGHGLSYTTFGYSDLTAALTGRAEDGDLRITVTCSVTNTGDRPGKEVVQLYVGDPVARVRRPVRELKAFAKLQLDPGESRPVTFDLTARDLSYWSAKYGGWVLEGGDFELAVGASSRDLRLRTTLDVPAPPLHPRLGPMATLEEWLDHPAGGPALRAAVGVDAHGNAQGILAAPELLKMIGNFPISSIAGFPGLGLDQQSLADLLATVAKK
ncbi:glycoside hydrolase family 3 domain protein [Kribbella flavida DSM 17836]|uniref:Exo-alpha-(1->6)-L-arabinopyranosidase n=1 Tax=Kribbella flavida (strain DSM 17836 / JCM 10339 / NBRC 14399) TaxID=479435 RepID=D2PKQ4_KRIFD|nr:glycoside hydrolase family 3 C-terminal domain-containing protein [Kribbella flavida]ADB32371.1 glycoside hydrolase family 3 domain protein [Kribbella flavida DSM 17836]